MALQYSNAIEMLSGTDTVLGTGGVTVDTTGPKQDVSLRSQIVVQFVRANHTSGNSVFSLDGSNDGTNWTTGLAFQDLTATASTTFVTSKTLSSNTTAAGKVPSGWRFIRAVLDVTTDGTSYVFMEAAG